MCRGKERCGKDLGAAVARRSSEGAAGERLRWLPQCSTCKQRGVQRAGTALPRSCRKRGNPPSSVKSCCEEGWHLLFFPSPKASRTRCSAAREGCMNRAGAGGLAELSRMVCARLSPAWSKGDKGRMPSSHASLLPTSAPLASPVASRRVEEAMHPVTGSRELLICTKSTDNTQHQQHVIQIPSSFIMEIICFSNWAWGSKQSGVASFQILHCLLCNLSRQIRIFKVQAIQANTSWHHVYTALLKKQASNYMVCLSY